MNVLTNFEKNTSMTPYGIVVLRWTLALYWGLDWYYQVLNQGMPATERLFVSLGYPAWFAWGEITFLVIAVIGLVLGLYVRTLSLLLLVILIPAMKLWIPNGIWAIHGGYEFPLLWILLQLGGSVATGVSGKAAKGACLKQIAISIFRCGIYLPVRR
jgi:putative oxidoreductase